MSNALAIATVTATLRLLINDAVRETVGDVDVRTNRPVGGADGVPAHGVNIYMYEAIPNPHWRNEDLPSRRGDGSVMQKPAAALDLHYLLTFHGDEAGLEPQRLMGVVVRTLHSQPVIARERLAAAAESDEYPFLRDSDLADAVESVRLTPLSLSLDDLSRLWNMFPQTDYSLSLGYQASVVLIESEERRSVALPVRDRNVYALPFRQPLIETLVAAGNPPPPLVVGGRLRINGRNLRGDITRLRIDDEEFEAIPADISATRIELTMTSPPVPLEVLRAGVHSLQVSHQQLLGTPPSPHKAFDSNAAAFVLRPDIETVEVDVDGNIAVDVRPLVGPRQRVVLLLNEVAEGSPTAHSLSLPQRDAGSAAIGHLVFEPEGIASGTYFVRLQVDGAESALNLEPGPGFGPTLEVP